MSRKGNGRGISFIRAHIDYDGPDCLIWPLNRNPEYGYSVLGYLGGSYYAHVYMCTLTNGPRPDGHQAAHSCGNGHLGCVHPKHLLWKTISDNLLDRREHGTVRCNPHGQVGILTAKQVEEIRALKGVMSQYEIARKFGVGRAAIQYWHKHDRPRSRFAVR